MENNACLTESNARPCNKPLCIIYVHGFMSSGNATKSKILSAAVTARFSDIAYDSPTLPHHPVKAMQLLYNMLDQRKEKYRFCFVGSSLGGFYAMHLAHVYPESMAVLINPTTNPWQTMDNYIGDYENPATGEKFSVTPEFVAALEQFKSEKIVDPQRFLLLLQTDDDVIDYHIAQQVFSDSPQIVRTGGGHQFSDFEQILPEMFDFIFKDQE